MKRIKQWYKSEEGFQVFEKFALMHGGVIVAIGIGLFVLAIVAYEYTRVENEFIGSQVEAGEAIQRFTP